MAINTTSTITADLQKAFSKKLLEHAVQELHLNEYALKGIDLPQREGAKVVRVFRRGAADAANVQTLTEGTAISTFTDVTLTPVDITLVQYGQAVRVSDIRTHVGFIDAMEQGIKQMGEEAALHADGISRNELVTGATQEKFAQGLANFAALSAATGSAATPVMSDFLNARIQLTKSRAPMFTGPGGKATAAGRAYVCILAPEMIADLIVDPSFVQAKVYGSPEDLYKGELGMMYGIRFVVATNPYREASGTEDTYTSSGDIFSNLILGQGAFGVPELKPQSIAAPQVTIVNQADSANPLNQYSTAGWKAFYGAKVLNGAYFTNLRCKTSYV